MARPSRCITRVRLLIRAPFFDSSRARGKTFKFTIGEGKVIGGWEVGLSTMQVGELATLTCASQYAYGAKGIPPMIPPAATLQFEVELVAVELPAAEATTFAEDNPLAPHARGHQVRVRVQDGGKDGGEGRPRWIHRLGQSLRIFGFFSTKEERPPWYLNPLITFPSIFAVVGVGFYLVVLLNVHRGEVPMSGESRPSLERLRCPRERGRGRGWRIARGKR